MANIVSVDITQLKAGNTIVLEKAKMVADKGEFVVISGASGSGKSTLINAIGNLSCDYTGEIKILGINNKQLSKQQRMIQLRNHISYIMQDNGLILNETVEKNIKYLPRVRKNFDRKRIEKIFSVLNLNPKLLSAKVVNLSGGEMQRVSIAKAILKKSDILICDEPTGNLDNENAKVIYKTLRMLANKGITIIMVSHDHNSYPYANTIYKLENKQLVKITQQ